MTANRPPMPIGRAEEAGAALAHQMKWTFAANLPADRIHSSAQPRTLDNPKPAKRAFKAGTAIG